MKMKLFLLLLCLSSTIAEIYIYTNSQTAAAGIAGLPEFSAVSFLHGKQIDYYNSIDHTLLPRQDWAKRLLRDWQKTTQKRFSESLHLQNGLRSAMESSGHREGVHTFQRLYGCIWDDESGISDGFDVYGYDGKTFLSLDLKTRRFTALVPQAKSMAREWNQNTTKLMSLQLYYTFECVAWLKTFFMESWSYPYHYHEINAIVVPKLIQHLKLDFVTRVTCHATGLSSKEVQMFWEKNEEEVDSFLRIGETLPSGDGSFQKTIYLYVELEDLIKNQYSCALQFMTLTGKSRMKMIQLTTLSYGVHSHSHARNFTWGSNDDDDDDEDYEEEEDEDE